MILLYFRPMGVVDMYVFVRIRSGARTVSLQIGRADARPSQNGCFLCPGGVSVCLPTALAPNTRNLRVRPTRPIPFFFYSLKSNGLIKLYPDCGEALDQKAGWGSVYGMR